jgi:hypothetical protein
LDAPSSADADATDEAAATARLRRRRIVGLFLVLMGLVVSYAVLFTDLYNRPPAVEKVFVMAGSEAKRPLDIYFEVLSMDPIRQAIQARLDFATKAEVEGLHFDSAPGSDMLVHVSDGYDVQDVELQAGVRSPSKNVELDVSGRIENYPVDRYEGKLLIGAFEGSASAHGAIAPIRLTAWEELNGWYVTVSANNPASDGRGLSLDVRVHRAHAQIFFAFLLYSAMVLIGGSALTIAGLSFVGTRKIEATLIAALGAMVFAVPALRNIMPGAPPLGVRADAFVFLWVQLTVILALTIFVGTGPTADRSPDCSEPKAPPQAKKAPSQRKRLRSRGASPRGGSIRFSHCDRRSKRGATGRY